MNISPRRPIFNRRPENNIYRIFFYLLVIFSGLWVYLGINRGSIEPIGELTPTPTRAAQSLSSEGDAHFTTGDLGASISSYRKALELDPNNAEIWSMLAQIQTYNSSMKTTDEERKVALTDALNSIDKAKDLVRAFQKT